MKSILFSLIALLILSGRLQAQNNPANSTVLTVRHQHIASISALTAKGDLLSLPSALADGLDAGLTVNEIREVLVHLAAYCGFPRSLQGINTFIAVLEGRKAKGILDNIGKEATAINNNDSKYQQGKKALEALTGQPEREPKTGYAVFAPIIDTFLKEHLFADIFGRNILSYTDREIATVSALVSMGGVEPMMRSHMGITMRLGITTSEMQQLLSIIEAKVGKDEADDGRSILAVLTNTNPIPNRDRIGTSTNLFAKGTKAVL